MLARPGKDLGEIEKLVGEEIERVKNDPVADWEIEKIHMISRHQEAQSFQSTLSRAMRLAQDAVYYNDPGLINTREEKIEKVTKADIQRVARKYLTDSNKTVIITMPKKAAAAGL